MEEEIRLDPVEELSVTCKARSNSAKSRSFKRKRKRASIRQQFYLVEKLLANLDIARATELGTNDDNVVEFWEQLSEEINLLGRVTSIEWTRTATEWRKVWTSWCSKLRCKCRRMKAYSEQDLVDGSNKEHLNEIESIMLDIISSEHEDFTSLREMNTAVINGEKQRTPKSRSESLSENKQGEMSSSVKPRKRSRAASTPAQVVNVECRICLQYVTYMQSYAFFGEWNKNQPATVASYFTQVTNIEVSPSDRHTKYICLKCLSQLRICVQFIETAHITETCLQKRYEFPLNDSSESLWPKTVNDTSESLWPKPDDSPESFWPKPIQVNKCLSNNNMIEIEVKQEVLSDGDVLPMETDNGETNLSIKEELEEYCTPQIMDTISITPMQENDIVTNDSHVNDYADDERENFLEEYVKEEPSSDNENDVTPDLPLDCMLCSKTFNSLSGLKAHVIAHHSYLKIARRKDATTPVYRCRTCGRTFSTRTDLIVHESCHGEYACYMCNSKFETFLKLSKHRKRCRNKGNHMSRLKTLEDVQRPSTDPQQADTVTEIESQTIHSAKAVDSTNAETRTRIIHEKAGTSTEAKSNLLCHIETTQPPKVYRGKTANSPTMTYAKVTDSNNAAISLSIEPFRVYQSKSNSKIRSVKMSKPDDMESKTENLTDSNSRSRKNTDAEEAYPNNTNNKSEEDDRIPVTYILNDRQSSANINITNNNNSRDSNNSKSYNPVIEDENTNSEKVNLDSDVKSHSLGNNSNFEYDISETYNPNRDLESQTPMDIDISSESEVFNLTLDSPNETQQDLNSPVPERNINKTSSDVSRRQSLTVFPSEVKASDWTILFDSDDDDVSVSDNLDRERVSDGGNQISDTGNIGSDSGNVVSENDIVVSVSFNLVSNSDILIADSDNIVSVSDNLGPDSSNLVSECGNLVSESSNLVSDTENLVSHRGNVVSDSDNIVSVNGNLNSDSSNLVSESGNLVSDNDNLVSYSDTVISGSGNIVSVSDNLGSDSGNLVSESGNLVSDTENLVSHRDKVISVNKLVSVNSNPFSDSSNIDNLISNNDNIISQSDKYISLGDNAVSVSEKIVSVSDDLVSDSGHSVSRNINLDDEDNITESSTESANKSLEVRELVENTPNLVTKNTPDLGTESDSMKIHLAIHSLEKKSLDDAKDVTIDEDLTETPESNEDKVIQ